MPAKRVPSIPNISKWALLVPFFSKYKRDAAVVLGPEKKSKMFFRLRKSMGVMRPSELGIHAIAKAPNA